jgi:hypothetical protein
LQFLAIFLGGGEKGVYLFKSFILLYLCLQLALTFTAATDLLAGGFLAYYKADFAVP